MTGSNLPPGCRDSDIPGNTPQDRADEALMDQIYTILESLDGSEKLDEIAEAIFKLCGDVYAAGYGQGITDEALANSCKEDC